MIWSALAGEATSDCVTAKAGSRYIVYCRTGARPAGFTQQKQMLPSGHAATNYHELTSRYNWRYYRFAILTIIYILMMMLNKSAELYNVDEPIVSH
jgi:hypothetical protein